MYKEKISAWVDAHKDEMLEDICELCRVNSEKMPAEEDMPFGPGISWISWHTWMLYRPGKAGL